jgi:flagellar hook-associated protein 1
MGLSGLDAALSGLRIAQQQISVISNNVANVSTPGFTRKTLPQVSQAIAGVTVGVLGQTIIRQVDLNLERDLWTQISGVNKLDVQAAYLKRVEQFHGPPNKELSIAAELGRLLDTFSSLADDPSDTFRQANAVNRAVDTARKINDLANLITTSRNDAQDEMQLTVNRINELLVQVADLNDQVEVATKSNRTSAVIEDKRDEAIKELSSLIEIDFFRRGDGVLVLQTPQGVELASDTAKTLVFQPSPVSDNQYYPANVAAIYVGDPLTDPGAVDITNEAIGGKLGGLINLRDNTFPKQMAQLDELAHKMALRFEAQGLRLFTDASGNIPLDTPPDPTTLPNPTPVEYVGFAGQIRVNQTILNDNSLLQRGTYGSSIPEGSNEVLRRIIQFTFGDTEFQQAIGDLDLRVSGNAAPNNTLQAFLGLRSENTVTGTRNLSSFTNAASLIASANGALDPGSDTFRMVFQDNNLGIGPINVDVSLAAVADGPGNFAQDLAAYINTTVVPGLPALSQAALTQMGATFSVGTDGQFVVESNAQITFDGSVVANGMGEDGLALLGFAEDTFEAEDPYFDIQVGNNESVRITIDSDDDENDLLAQLNAVPGLAVENLTLSADGFLRLRPGDDYANPDFGGDIRIIAGSFQASNAGANTVIGPGTVPNGINIVSALFGSFSTGPLQDVSPVTGVRYGSQTNGSLTPPIPTQPFRTGLLGPGVNISTQIIGSLRLVDFAQKMVNEQSQQVAMLETRKADEQSLQDVLQKQLLNDSSVNLDEELGTLVVMQTAYAASARVVNAVNDMFDELLNAVL